MRLAQQEHQPCGAALGLTRRPRVLQRFSDGLCVEVSVPVSLPVAFPFSIPVGPGDDGRGLCVELVLPIPSALGSAGLLVLL
jgi:hypothetical protein